MSSTNPSRIGITAKIGALCLLLWGILHIWVGYEGIHLHISATSVELWNMLIGGANAPHSLFQHTTDILTANVHKHLLLNFCIDVGGYGVLGVILAYMIYKKGSWAAYWIAVVIIGIADLTFLFSMVTPGIIALTWESVSGPIIWFVAIMLIPFGLPKGQSEIS